MGRFYSDGEIAWLHRQYPKTPRRKTRELFKKRFGKALSASQLSNLFTKHRFERRPPGGQFRKGHVPHNTGMKMSEEFRRKMAATNTWFKKGSEPVNTREMYSERYSKREGVLIRVPIPDPHRPHLKYRWIAKSRWIWIRNHGEIPEGHAIIHLDGDNMNHDIENLECVPRKVLAILNNRAGLRPSDQEGSNETRIRVAQLKARISELKRGAGTAGIETRPGE